MITCLSSSPTAFMTPQEMDVIRLIATYQSRSVGLVDHLHIGREDVRASFAHANYVHFPY